MIHLIPFLLLKFKVSGHSMLPTLKPDQEILVSSLPYIFTNPKRGDLIAFKKENKFIVKRINQIKGNKVLTAGDNKNDSKKFGWIEKKEIIGKVVYKL